MPGPVDPQAGSAPQTSIPKLRLIVAGTGRDGTTTLRTLVRSLAQLNGPPWVVPDELYCGHILNLVCVHRETGIDAYRETLRALLRQVPAHALVGPAYQFALDLLSETHGAEVKLIHLRRRDRDACIRSLERIIHYRPAAAINYTREACRTDIVDYYQRPTAHHYGEMTRAEWEALDLSHRIAWYYDRTHALIEAAKSGFAGALDIATEELNDPRTVEQVARFIDPGWTRVCEPCHLNSSEALIQDERSLAIRRAMLLHPDDET